MRLAATIARIAGLIVLNALLLLAIDALLPGLDIKTFGAAVAMAIAITVLNALLWPLVISVALRLVVLTLGIGAIVLNGVILVLAHSLLDNVRLDLDSAIAAALLLTLGNVLVTTALGLTYNDLFYERVVLRAVRRAARQRGRKVEDPDVPGVLFLEIDGLAEPVFRRALLNGHMPTLAGWLATGSHRIVQWECDLSSQTGASQAGLLLGSNDDMPAFRWYEKESGKAMVSNHPRDAAEIERRRSNGNGLLAGAGTSRGNLLSGDAPRTLLTLSKVRERLYTRDFYAYYADPYNAARTLLLSLWDIALEIQSAIAQRRRDIRPRVGRGGIYPLLRVAMTVMMRDLNIAVLIGDMLEGVRVSYATFVGYDEVAHHSGIERRETLDTLSRLDQQFARLARAAKLAPRPYQFVVLSDHGQSQGATFLQRYGMTLEDLVRQAVSEERTVAAVAPSDEAWGALGGALTQAANARKSATAWVLRRTARRRSEDGAITVGPDREQRREDATIEKASVVVMPSGNLALIYLTEWDERVSYEEIEAKHPGLLQALAEHPGIGFLLVRSRERGPLAIGGGGVRELCGGGVEGEDPLKPFGPNAAQHLLRTDGFEHAPDILVNSQYHPITEEVAAFEELVGSHGGLGGPQSKPFALVPAGWSPEPDEIVGAERMHEVLCGWLVEGGIRDGEAGAAQ